MSERAAESADEINQKCPSTQSMTKIESRLEGLRYRVDALRGDIPDHRVAGIWGRIEGRYNSYVLTQGFEDGKWEEKMHTRIDDIEEEIEYLEDWANGPESHRAGDV